jgi:hypothetical protein
MGRVAPVNDHSDQKRPEALARLVLAVRDFLAVLEVERLRSVGQKFSLPHYIVEGQR